MAAPARDPRFIRLIVALYTPYRMIHRVRFEGLEKIPDRPCLLVANHSIGAVVEIFGILYAWEKRFGFRYDHPAYGLAHRISSRVPLVSSFMTRVGSIPAEFDGAKCALDSGASVLVFPGGNWEATRGFWRGNEVDFGEHRGWVRVAKSARVDVVPISISGSYAVNPVLARSRWLAKLTLLDPLLAVRWLPVTVGQLLWASLFFAFAHRHLPAALGALGTLAVFALTPMFPIWPARVTIRFGDPIPSDRPADELERDGIAAIRAGLNRPTPV